MKYFFCAIIALIGLSSCSIESDTPLISYEYVAVNDVVIPSSFEFGQSYDILVTFTMPNDCYIFSGFEMTPNNNERIVRVVLTKQEENGTCENNSVMMTREEILRFRVMDGEDYIFKFSNGVDDQGNETFLEYTVTVN
jgi:hypothetical protein